MLETPLASIENCYSVHNRLMSVEHIEDLKVFAQAVESGTLAAAGRTLGLAPSIVSRRLARLERALDAGGPFLRVDLAVAVRVELLEERLDTVGNLGVVGCTGASKGRGGARSGS